jgi:pimeloyl-ACP methyl ester carboxylesterase
MEDFLSLFFDPSESSQQAGRAFWDRRHQRRVDVDPPSSMQTALAQRAALTEWAQPRGQRFADLRTITQPTLVVNGNHDIMLPTINSYILSQHLPEGGAGDLSRLRSRVALPVPDALRPPRVEVSRRRTRVQLTAASSLEIHDE